MSVFGEYLFLQTVPRNYTYIYIPAHIAEGGAVATFLYSHHPTSLIIPVSTKVPHYPYYLDVTERHLTLPNHLFYIFPNNNISYTFTLFPPPAVYSTYLSLLSSSQLSRVPYSPIHTIGYMSLFSHPLDWLLLSIQSFSSPHSSFSPFPNFLTSTQSS